MDPAPAGSEGRQPSGDAARRFTLQVGACGSLDCVTGYRALLAGKVDGATVRVLRQERAGGRIYRIRIGPFTREEAEAMRKRLVAADAQFNGAYLIRRN